MKRLWIGVGVLAVLLAVSLALLAGMQRMHKGISRDLDAAAEAALDGNWALARERTEKAAAVWHRGRHAAASLADHEPLETMDALFDLLKMLGRLERGPAFAGVCIRLSHLSGDVGESHALHLWSLF